ncbi:Low-complexity acidic protein [Rhodovulum sp. P5]|uniref:hypothetical protein n=1 Tax=Rhodovulum sp. P5 TaxID=1564506 RepID=UPI0009C29F07|nr:hypothetical protein [Rhodovulum sp. P5]ARE41548.1 Low-complexity acidic protein [Rhodovulum sp. P5]
MTCNPTPPFYAAFSPFWAVNSMFEQQMRVFQMMTELMLKANPWIIIAEAGTIDPLTADAAIGKGDNVDDLNLEASAALASSPAPRPAAPAALKVVQPDGAEPKAEVETPPAARVAAPSEPPAMPATPAVKKPPVRKRTAPAARKPAPAAKASGEAAAKPAAARAAATTKTRARRKPAQPPVMPQAGNAPSDKDE